MPDSKISALPPITTPLPTDLMVTVQAGVTSRLTRAQTHTLEVGERLILPEGLSFTAPVLAFGDGTAGFVKTGTGASERLAAILAGNSVGEWLSTGFSQGLGNGAGLSWLTPSSTVPSLVTNVGETTTGVGRNSSTAGVTLICRSIGMLEANEVEVNVNGDLNINSGSTSDQTMILGEPTVVRTGQDSFFEMYGESSGLIYGTRFGQSGTGLSISGVGTNPSVAVTFTVGQVSLSNGAWLRHYGDNNIGQELKRVLGVGGTNIQHDLFDGALNYLYNGTGVFNVQGGLDLQVKDGGFLKILDASDTDSAEFSHDGTDFNTDFTNTADWDITGIQDFNLRAGVRQRFYSTDDSVYLQVAATNTQHTFTSSTAVVARWEVWSRHDYRDGPIVRIRDATNANFADFSHDGTDFNTDFVNTDSWNISEVSVKITLPGTAGTRTSQMIVSGNSPSAGAGIGKPLLLVEQLNSSGNTEIFSVYTNGVQRFTVDNDGDVKASQSLGLGSGFTIGNSNPVNYITFLNSGANNGFTFRTTSTNLGRGKVTIGTEIGATHTLTQNASDDNVLIRRDRDGIFTYTESGALLRLEKDLVDMVSDNTNFLEMANDVGGQVIVIDGAGRTGLFGAPTADNIGDLALGVRMTSALQTGIYVSDNFVANSKGAGISSYISSVSDPAKSCFIGQHAGSHAVTDSSLTGWVFAGDADVFTGSNGAGGFMSQISCDNKQNTGIAYGYVSYIRVQDDGTNDTLLTNGVGYLSHGNFPVSTSTITNQYDFKADQWNNTGNGTITNRYGLYIDFDGTGVTNAWGVYSPNPNVQHLFAGNISLNSDLTINNIQPAIFLQENDVAADTGNWIEKVSGGTWKIVTATDAAPEVTVATPLSITRSGSSPINVKFENLTGGVQVRDGAYFQIRDAGDTDYVTLSHGGIHFNYDYTNTVSVIHEGNTGSHIFYDTNMIIEDRSGTQTILQLGGPTVRGNNSSDAKLLMFGENGGTKYAIAFNCTSANMQFTGDSTGGATPITNFRFNDLDVDIYTGRQFRIKGASNTPTVTFVHDDTDFNTSFASTTDWNIGSGLTGIINSDVDIIRPTSVGRTAHVGSAQGNGVITAVKNVYSTVANTGDAATLPATFIVGQEVLIKNDGANSMDIFPASGDDAGAGTNNAVALASGAGTMFMATAANATWTQMYQ